MKYEVKDQTKEEKNIKIKIKKKNIKINKQKF